MLPFTTRPEIRGTFGVAASTHWIASQVAMGVLERGGNAFDAAISAGFALQVLEPHLNGPGGEVPIVFWSAKEKRVRVLCGQGNAPAAADAATFRRMDDAASRPWHVDRRRSAAPGDRVRARWLSAGAARGAGDPFRAQVLRD